MTREQRLVTLAFLALMVVGVLAFASSSRALPERPIARLIEADFAPVSLPAPRAGPDLPYPATVTAGAPKALGVTIQAQLGAPEDPAPLRQGNPRTLPGAPSPSPRATPDAAGGGSKPVTVQPSPAPLPRGTATARSGTASTYGPGWDGWIAIPEGPGWRIRVCGAGGCLRLVSTDAGPDRAMQRAPYYRIIDLDVSAFEQVCGVPWRMGLCPVTLTILGRAS